MKWLRTSYGFHECWPLRRAEIMRLDFGWFASLRHGDPKHVGVFPTLREAKAACEAEAARQDAEAEARREAAEAFAREILMEDDET